IDPVVEERNVLHGAVVRFDERETVVSALEHRVPGRVVVRAAAPYRPEKRAREREGAARIEHAVEIRAADLYHERRSARRRRRSGIRDRPLCVAECRSAPHPEPAVEPALCLQPRERLESVATLVHERLITAAGLIASARTLNDDHIAAVAPVSPEDRCTSTR